MRRRLPLLLIALLLIPTSSAVSGEAEVRLLTDETIPLYLARGRELARNAQWETMVDVLQRIVVGDPKVFPDLRPDVLNAAVYSEDNTTFYPARELCLKELAAMPPEGLRAYRARHDALAREMLEQAGDVQELEDRIAAYARVFDAYLVSSVGDDALELAADLQLELGRYYEALAHYRRLVEVYPKDTDRNLPMVLAKAAYCAARIGDREHRDVLLERLASEYPRARILVEGSSVASGALKDHAALRVGPGAERRLHDWSVPGGGPDRARVIRDLPEDLPRTPFWTFRLSQRDPRMLARFGEWEVAVHDREEAPRPMGSVHSDLLEPYPTVRAILHDGVVFYKDCVELVARRVGSGTYLPFGRYEAAGGDYTDPAFKYPLRYVRPNTVGNDNQARLNEDIHRFLDYGGNSVVAHGDSVLVVENKKVLSYLRSDQAPKPRRANLLVTYNRRNGKTLWGWEADLPAASVKTDPQALQEWNADFQAHPRPTFRGPGVASGGMLYTVAYEADGLTGVSLWAFDLDDGRVRFRTLLHHPDEVAQRLPVGASLSVAGGVVYVATGSGVLAAVDALPPGRVRWITRYRRNVYQAKRNTRRRRFGGTTDRINPQFAYNDPIVIAGKVIAAPPDSAEVIAFNAESGRVAWRIPKRALGKVAHIVGASNGVLVLAGAAVCGIDANKGELLWGPDLMMDAFAYGRGLVGEKYAYVPTMRPGEKRAAIHRYDLKSGAQATPLRFDVGKLGNLLAVDGRLVVANEDEVMCFTTPERELGEIEERIRREGLSAALLVERAQVLERAGRPDEETLAAFVKALDAAKRTGEHATPVRIRALDFIFRTAVKRRELAPLETARGILEAAAAEKGPFRRLEAYEAQTEFIAARLMAELGRPREAFEAIEKFLDDYASHRVVAGGEVLDGSAAARQLRADLVAKDKAFLTVFVEAVRKRIEAAEKRRDTAALLGIPARYDYANPTQESLFALSRLYETEEKSVEAEGALREVLERYTDNVSVAEAHLRIARLLLSRGMPVAARIERNKAVGRLDEASRARLADLLAEVDRQLPATGQAAIIPELRTPLRSAPLRAADIVGAPVRVDGDSRTWNGQALLLADEHAYYAIDADGALLWRQANPAGAGISFGPANHPDTCRVAALVAARRTATAAGGRLVIGDVFGLTCLDARTGKVHWQRPRIRADAARAADAALRALRADLDALRAKDELLRGQRLPTYAASASAVVAIHPLRGVEAFEVATGELLWQDTEVRSPTLGRPHLLGQLLAVGWADPGRIRVYGMADGRIYHEHEAPEHGGRPGALLAPPLLDPLGRLVVIFGRADAANPEGALEVRDARNGERAFAKVFPANSRHAAVLYADGHALVFHDGGSGGLNLHFIDLATQRTVSRVGADIMRELDIAQDGTQLYVFTHTPGLADLGGRLFRVDIEGKDTLAYEPVDQAGVFSRLLLTRNHVAIADRAADRARLRLFDRDASRDTRGPRPVFATQVGVVEVFEVAGPSGRFHIPPAAEGVGGGLVFTNPYRNLRFSAPEGR